MNTVIMSGNIPRVLAQFLYMYIPTAKYVFVNKLLPFTIRNVVPYYIK